MNKINRGGCELCNCAKFLFFNSYIKYKCKCGHGDVWHKRCPEQKKIKKISVKQKINNFIKPLLNIFNDETINKTNCPICLEHFNIKNMAILNCGHIFCRKCIQNVNITCPMCRTYITNKTNIYI